VDGSFANAAATQPRFLAGMPEQQSSGILKENFIIPVLNHNTRRSGKSGHVDYIRAGLCCLWMKWVGDSDDPKPIEFPNF
jgi:hypothetical protein